MDASREELEIAIAHTVPDKPYPKHIDETVFLELQSLLGQHPDEVFSVWARENPRLFLLLRMLGCEDDVLYQKLDSQSIGDLWLPLGSATLNQLSSHTDISPQNWQRAQLHVLSKSDQMSEQKLTSPIHAHRHILSGDAHFEQLEKLGKGGSAEVARVRHKLSAREYACKRIKRASEIKTQRNQLLEFKAEVGVLKRVSHHHLVSFVASFTDSSSFSLILNPVAKDVLKSMLDRQSRDQPLPERDICTLRRSFGCLATALAYLHAEGVRHKDIKPGNILLSDGLVYLCDFGIARDWSEAEHSTTDDEILKVTPRYCAPEVFSRDPRNTKSDVFSLGCVFLEIISVVKGYSMEELNEFLVQNSEHQSNKGLSCALDAMNAWMEEIRTEKNDSADDIPLGWITTMIRSEREHRVKASELVETIMRASSELESPDSYIGPCCTRNDSVALPNTIDSPTLNSYSMGGLGISAAQSAFDDYHPDPPGTGGAISSPRGALPSSPNSLRPPKKFSNDLSAEKSSTPKSNPNDTEHRTRSISPRTRSFGPRDSTETSFNQKELTRSRSTDPSTGSPIQHIASRTDSNLPISHVDSLRGEPQAISSPVPPPAKIDVKCNCAAQSHERHILNMPYTFTSEITLFDPDIPTIETCAKCEVGEDRIQIYESSRSGPATPSTSAMPMLWWTTRRLVISYASGQPKMRHCSSFWLPLADVQFKLRNSTVTLKWSDCNQLSETMAGNYTTHYNWIYNPSNINNTLQIRFSNPDSAHQFIDTVRLPHADAHTVTHTRRIDVSPTTELNIFDVGARPGIRNYRAVTLTIVSDAFATSKLYIQWPEADLDIHIRDSFDARSAATTGYEMVVEMGNVTTPTYHSDTRGEPAPDAERVARFAEARQLKTSLAVAFPIGVKHGLPKPPGGVTNMLEALTGWTLRYFAIVTSLRSPRRHLGMKRYGAADVMLWEKEIDDGIPIPLSPSSSTSSSSSTPKTHYANGHGIANGNGSGTSTRRGARLVFRQHEGDSRWVTGCITAGTSMSMSTGGLDATISVSRKARGDLLHVGNMVAIPSDSISKQGISTAGSAKGKSRGKTGDLNDDGDEGGEGEMTGMVLSFENEMYRLSFLNLATHFKERAATSAPLSRPTTRVGSIRRMSSLAEGRKSSASASGSGSGAVWGPPMRGGG